MQSETSHQDEGHPRESSTYLKQSKQNISHGEHKTVWQMSVWAGVCKISSEKPSSSTENLKAHISNERISSPAKQLFVLLLLLLLLLLLMLLLLLLMFLLFILTL